MVDVGVLNSVAIDSFRKNSIRSVLLIDERFPKHFQVGTERFQSADAEICSELYRQFNGLGLLCDVENDVERVKRELTSHIRKSDLLILDLHLGEDPKDTTDSTAILNTLADSDQFNLVIVYTNEPELNDVARQLAASLRGPLPPVDATDELRDDLELKIAGLRESIDDIPTHECVDSFLLGDKFQERELGRLKGQIAKELEVEFKPYLNQIIWKFAEHSLRNKIHPQECLRTLEAGDFVGTNPWFVCGSVFVVMANKSVTRAEDGRVLDVLDDALADWNPGIVRCLLSEIQNCINNAGHHFKSFVGNDALTQVGWLYHALEEQQKGDEYEPQAVGQLTDRVVGRLRERVKTDQRLLELSKRCLKAIEFKDDPKERVQELSNANGVPADTKLLFPDVLHALNQFLSSEDFGLSVTEDPGLWVKV